MALSDILEGSKRGLSYAIGVSIPVDLGADKGFKECGFSQIALADAFSTDDYKNDYKGFFFKQQTPDDTCIFTLIDVNSGDEYVITDDTYGEFIDFGISNTQPRLTIFIIEWKKVLTELDSGCYQIRKDIVIAGVESVELSDTFNLCQFTVEKADGTIRIDCIQNGQLRHLSVDFKGTGFRDSVRVPGFFGNQDSSYTHENIVYSNDVVNQISVIKENEYEMNIDLIPVSITKQIFDFIFLGNEIFVNDYNIDNHSYEFVRLPVEFSNNEGTAYFRGNRNAALRLKFSDRVKNIRKENC